MSQATLTDPSPTPYYQDDLVTLYCGDCREIAEWLTADVLVMDPPYGIKWTSGQMFIDGRAPHGETITGDQDVVYRDHALIAWGQKPAIVFGSWRQPRPDDTLHRLIWHKAQAYPGLRTSPWYPSDEEIYVLGTGFVGQPTQSVYVTHEMRAGRQGLAHKVGHPTPKPVGLMENLLAKCPPGVIADPFAGSGSTLVAAKLVGRRAIGVEIEERYCEIAARRIAQDALPFGENHIHPVGRAWAMGVNDDKLCPLCGAVRGTHQTWCPRKRRARR